MIVNLPTINIFVKPKGNYAQTVIWIITAV